MHQRNPDVIPEVVEIRDSALRIPDPGRNKTDPLPVPEVAHHDFGVEIHPAADMVAAGEREELLHGVHAVPAHAVPDF